MSSKKYIGHARRGYFNIYIYKDLYGFFFVAKRNKKIFTSPYKRRWCDIDSAIRYATREIYKSRL